MTPSDRTELKELLSDHLIGFRAEQKANYDMLKFQLDTIENTVSEIRLQTIKTNGRVNELEKREIGHFQTCPNSIALKKVQQEQESSKAIKRYLIVASTIVAGLGLIVLGIIEIIHKA
jgi:hypothetical protein